MCLLCEFNESPYYRGAWILIDVFPFIIFICYVFAFVEGRSEFFLKLCIGVVICFYCHVAGDKAVHFTFVFFKLLCLT